MDNLSKELVRLKQERRIDAMVRLAQDFSTRYLLVTGQGNFGSVDGDPPAAYRYTEAKMSRLAEEMLRDLEKETVLWAPNFDGSKQEPTVLPAAAPTVPHGCRPTSIAQFVRLSRE